jgi:hypothetical protein
MSSVSRTQPPAVRTINALASLVLAGVLGACAGTTAPQERSPVARHAAFVHPGGSGLLARFAPVFVTEHAEQSHNRIGTPIAEIDGGGSETVRIDPDRATIYRRVVPFSAGDRRYTNLVYRVHFERNPFTWLPLNLGAGRNVGLLAIVTLNEAEEPVYVTTVHTCGCYHAVLPTNFLPATDRPEDWDAEGLEVYGEHLPGRLTYPAEPDTARLVIRIRGDTHRVMDVDVLPFEWVAATHDVIDADAADTEALETLEHARGITSFFHTEGRRKGLVKGAWKPLETLIFGLWIRDFHVGRDRRYGPEEHAGQLFYTTLNPVKKTRSDMWNFRAFLELNGWKPDATDAGTRTLAGSEAALGGGSGS